MTIQKVALVTGAASGIGRACAQRLLSEGYAICSADIMPSKVPEPEGDSHFHLQLDVSDGESCNAAVNAVLERFGRMDALVHMAAIHSSKTWRELDATDFSRVMSVNVLGAFLICQAAARAMEPQHEGAIVLATSNAVTIGGVGGNGRGGPAYVTSKAAILGLTRALARSLGPLGIRVNAVAPGSTATPMTAHYSEDALKAVAGRTLAGRIGEAREIAAAVSFLISADASYVYGETVNVNGGGSFGF